MRKSVTWGFLVIALLSGGYSYVLTATDQNGAAGGEEISHAKCQDNYLDQKNPVVLKRSMAENAVVLCFTEFALLHSSRTRTPLWVAEHLTKEGVVAAKGVEREDVFHAEQRLSGNDRSELEDYARTGYDRGHMAPAADMATLAGQDESFSLANMVPQIGPLNRKLWQNMEATARALAYSYGEIYVVTGPAFVGGSLKQLNRRVLVPTDTFKAIYVPKANAAAAWWADNEGAGTKYETISISELTERTGIDPFPSLGETLKMRASQLPSPKAHADRHIPKGPGPQASSSGRISTSGGADQFDGAGEGAIMRVISRLISLFWTR